MEKALASKLKPEQFTTTPRSSQESKTVLKGNTKVLIGGFDGAGKSTLACSMHAHFENQGINSSLYELDRWSDTHDIIFGRKPPAHRNKRSEIDPEEFIDYADSFARDRSSIVIGDLQGRYQYHYNVTSLMGVADLGVLVTRDKTAKDETNPYQQTEEGWLDLFHELNVPSLLRVKTTLEPSVLSGEDSRYGEVVVSGLNRRLVPDNPGVQHVGKLVLQFAKHFNALKEAQYDSFD